MVVHFSAKVQAFYRHKPNNQDPGELGGANAPPNSPRLPRKRGFCRVSAARATPCWWVTLVSPSDFIWSWFLRLDPGF